MADKSTVPTLSTDGWVRSTAEKADYLISHFFVSEYSQTHLYSGNVASFQWILKEKAGNMMDTRILLVETLTRYFSRYFSKVEVEATFSEIVANTGKYQIDLYIQFVDEEDKTFVLSRVVNVVDTKIEKILTINNTIQV